MTPHKRVWCASLPVIMGKNGASANSTATGANFQLDEARRLLLRGRHDTERGARLIHDHFWQQFFNWYKSRRQSDETAEEMANDAIFKIVEAIDDLRDPAKFQPWAWQIARNVLNDRVRNEKAIGENEVTFDDHGWQALLDHLPQHAEHDRDGELSLCLKGQFERFAVDHPERHWVFERIVLDGWGDSEFMAALGRTATATRQYLTQCRNRLREYMKPCLEDAR